MILKIKKGPGVPRPAYDPAVGTPTLRLLGRAEHAAGVAFYASQGYESGISAEDVPLAALDGERIVGLVRLVREEGHQILRGMFIDAAYQRRGLGARMLEALEAHMDPEAPCWLLCPPRLHRFYGRIGFEPARDDAMPAHLRPRVARYRALAPNGAMRRPPQAP